MSARYLEPFKDISDITRHFMSSPTTALNLDTKSSRIETLSHEENSATSKEIEVEDSPHSEDRYRNSAEPADDMPRPSVSSEKIGSPISVSPCPEIMQQPSLEVMTRLRNSAEISEENTSDYFSVTSEKHKSFIPKLVGGAKFPGIPKMNSTELDIFQHHLTLTAPSTIDLSTHRRLPFIPPSEFYSHAYFNPFFTQDLYKLGSLTEPFAPSRSSSLERLHYVPRSGASLSSHSTVATATH